MLVLANTKLVARLLASDFACASSLRSCPSENYPHHYKFAVKKINKPSVSESFSKLEINDTIVVQEYNVELKRQQNITDKIFLSSASNFTNFAT